MKTCEERIWPLFSDSLEENATAHTVIKSQRLKLKCVAMVST